MSKKSRLFFVFLVSSFCLSLLGLPVRAEGDKERQIAETIAAIMTGARVVIAENQALFNDPNIGDKGFNVAVFEQKASIKIKELYEIDVKSESLPAEAKAMWEAEKATIQEAQAIINKKGVAYKGFLPAVFAKIAAAKFMAKAPGTYAKLTTVTPIRNAVNKPDKWESKVGNMFRSPDYTKGTPYSEVATMKGKKMLRLMQPEYYKAACLGCHGKPKGESHIGGGKKEGLEEGEAGAGFSVAIPIK